MMGFTKFATTGALALGIATAGFGAAPASAHDHLGGGAGLFLGLATGLIVGGAIASERHHPDYYYGDAGYDPGPACHPGRLQWRWQQVCQPDAYGQLYCRNVKSYYRPEICY